MSDPEILSSGQQLRLRSLEFVLSVAISNKDLDAEDYWPFFHIVRDRMIAEGQQSKAPATNPRLLFATVEHVPTGFADGDTLAGQINYVTDWPQKDEK